MHLNPVGQMIGVRPYGATREAMLLFEVIFEYGTLDEVDAVLADLRARAVKMIERGPRSPDNALGFAAE